MVEKRVSTGHKISMDTNIGFTIRYYRMPDTCGHYGAHFQNMSHTAYHTYSCLFK